MYYQEFINLYSDSPVVYYLSPVNCIVIAWCITILSVYGKEEGPQHIKQLPNNGTTYWPLINTGWA